ncbi:hypothetical protein EJB05_16872, partial [Eragrostis curvula]
MPFHTERTISKHASDRQPPSPSQALRLATKIVFSSGSSLSRSKMSLQQQEMSSLEQPREGSAPSPCAKGCGFFGSPATQNMCSVCFMKHLVATAEPAASKAAEKTTGDAAAVAGVEAAASAEVNLTDAELRQKAWVERCRAAVAENYWGSRCSECHKKMTLVGRFTCRCGRTYCPTHRHSEAHACAYDYQRAGVISIICSNPLIKGQKLRDRI